MKRRSNLFLIIGFLLILGSLVLLLSIRIQSNAALERCGELTARIEALIPERTPGIQDDYLVMEMPVLQIDDLDLAGIVEIPAFGVKLPIYNTWDAGKVNSLPCRFWGTVYDGSLIIGGADQSGQFDCFDMLSPGASVTVTDMTGGVFSYRVSRIDRSKSADAGILTGKPGDLILFARDAYSMEYLIVCCTADSHFIGLSPERSN